MSLSIIPGKIPFQFLKSRQEAAEHGEDSVRTIQHTLNAVRLSASLHVCSLLNFLLLYYIIFLLFLRLKLKYPPF